MTVFKMTFLASSFALLAACGGSDKIDGSTEAKFAASMTSISQNIDIAKKDEFDRSLSVVRRLTEVTVQAWLRLWMVKMLMLSLPYPPQ